MPDRPTKITFAADLRDLPLSPRKANLQRLLALGQMGFSSATLRRARSGLIYSLPRAEWGWKA